MVRVIGIVSSGPGFIVVQLMGLAIVSWLVEYISTAIGKPQIAQTSKVLTMLIALGMIIATLWSTMNKITDVLGL